MNNISLTAVVVVWEKVGAGLIGGKMEIPWMISREGRLLHSKVGESGFTPWLDFTPPASLLPIKGILLVLLGCLFFPIVAPADTNAPLSGAVSPSATSGIIALDEIKVLNVSPKTNRLNAEVSITVTDLSKLLAAAKQRQRGLVLSIRGMGLPDVSPDGMCLASNILYFTLKRTAANKDIWSPLLSSPLSQPVIDLPISVAVLSESPLLADVSAPNTYLWKIGWNWWVVAWLTVFVLLLIVFILLSVYSDILRGPVPDNTGRYPFSLSRCQAAFWLFITAFSFVFIWVITGDIATFNASVLGLLGISAGTYLASTFMEGSPGTQATPDAAVIPAAPAAPPPAPAVKPPIAIVKLIAKASNNVAANLQRIRLVGYFLGDILTDNTGGISVQRFQIFVWTIILGIIFMVSVINELSMPEFNGTLLALMGLSSATYVGAKLNR